MPLANFLTQSAKNYPDRLALECGGIKWSYSLLQKRVRRLVCAFQRVGLKKGDRVALALRNGTPLVETLLGCFQGGFAAVPMNVKLHPQELAYMIQDSGAKAVVYDPCFHYDFQKLFSTSSGVRSWICLESKPDALSYEDLLTSAKPEETEVEFAEQDLAWIFYTSGTTGHPKGAMLTHGNLSFMIGNYYTDMSPVQPEDIFLHVAPLTHGSGLYLLPALAKGAANILLKMDKFDPELVLKTVEEAKITHIAFMVPTMINRLVSHKPSRKYNLESLRCIVYGGSPMYVEDMKRALNKFGQIFVQLYGQAEAPMTISYLSKEEHVLKGDAEREKRLSSAGVVRTGVQVNIFDEQDHELPSGRLGEIVVRGDIVMRGYWNKPEATAEALRGGWLHTGDLGMMDEGGYLYLLDRKKDLIISGGSNIYPREVEEVLLRHPAILEAAVIGVPDPEWGELVKAVVVLREGMVATEEEIIQFCKNHLASFKKPKSVEFVAALPKSGYGKILKRELRDRYWEGQSRKV
ncbi:MAG: long-chain fatty acid--CoA ligase [Elusimicrobia bacterium]|nr:long-chain fatty acid--CoA ligase [Elusimicrobiota bacterium]